MTDEALVECRKGIILASIVADLARFADVASFLEVSFGSAQQS